LSSEHFYGRKNAAGAFPANGLRGLDTNEEVGLSFESAVMRTRSLFLVFPLCKYSRNTTTDSGVSDRNFNGGTERFQAIRIICMKRMSQT